MRKLSWAILLIIPLVVFGVAWKVEVQITDGTATRTLKWGLHPDATDGYDFGIDENYPLIPPSGLYTFFPVDDPTNPYVTMLSEDIRQDTVIEHLWKATAGGTFDSVTASWDPADIPLGNAFVGLGTFAEEPVEWISMTTNSFIKYYPGDYLWISFTPATSGEDDNPPYVVSTYPTDGASSVPTDAVVQITLTDDETGIDPESIELQVNSVDVTSLATVQREGNQWIVRYSPAEGFPTESMITVSISAADIGAEPNYVNYSFSFTTSGAPSPVLWEVPIVMNTVSAGADTVEFPLSFGVAEDASQLFDPEFDVPFPGPVPGEFYAYFPLADPEYEFSMLKRDIRSSSVESEWIVRMGNPGTTVWASWNLYDIPDGVELYIASAFPPDEPTEWYSMSDVNELEITVGEWIWISESTPVSPDEEPPYLVSSIPEIGAAGIPPETELNIIISDYGTGVDVSSIILTVEGEDVSDLCSITETEPYVYIVYSPDTGFTPSSRIDWTLSAADLAEPPNSTLIEGYFNTGFYPTPDWLANLNLYIYPFEDDSLSSSITFGTDEAGTDYFDMGLDYLYAPPPPGASSFYFYIEDTIWTQLSRDIRSSYQDSVIWIAYAMNLDTSFAEYSIGWQPSELPSSGTFLYSWVDMASEPEEWTSMREVNEIDIANNGKFYILYRSELPRYCVSGIVGLEGTDELQGSIVEIVELGLSDTTDETGNYQICDIPAGNYTIIISHTGYETHEDEIAVMDDTEYDIMLNLVRYTFSGLVIPEGAPEYERDSIVVVLGSEMVYTDSSGYFQIENVLPGAYTLHIEWEDYYPIDTVIEIDSDLYVEFFLEHLTYTVSGWIELQGLPYGEWDSTEVTLGEWSTLTSESGYFEFLDVPPDEYNFHAEHDTDYIPFDTLLTVDDDITLEITLEREEILTGDLIVFVSLEGSASLSGSRVVIQELDDTAYTNAMGRARFRNVEYGDYNVEVSREYYETVVSEVALYSPAETLNVSLSLRRGIIEGFVYLDDDPMDLSGTQVTLDGSTSTETDVTGYFSFDNVVFGSHNLYFEHSAEYTTVDTNITLAAPGTAFVEVTLENQILLNPPRNPRVISSYHNRVASAWDPPEPSAATLVGYGVIRSTFGSIDTIAYVPAWCTGHIDYDGEAGLFSVFAIYEEGNSNAVGYNVGWPGDDPDAPDILIMDFDNGALLANDGTSDEAVEIQQLLWTGGVTCQITNQDQQLDEFDLLYFRGIFIITGIWDDDNTMISEQSLAKILNYMAAGGKVFWEGADIAADYEDVFDGAIGWSLGITLANDGRPSGGNGNVSQLYGQPPYFSEEFYYDQHSTADHYVDELELLSSGNAMLRSQSVNPSPVESDIRMVASEVSLADYGYTSIWRTVASSIYLGGIQYYDQNSNRYEVLRGIWYFLFDEELPATIEEPDDYKLPAEINMTLTPTPFNSSLEISVSVHNPQEIGITVKDISGRHIANIYEGTTESGKSTFHWVPHNNVSSGVYLVVLETGDNKIVRRAVLLR